MTRLSGLGRGLDALIPAAAPGQSGLAVVPVESVVANPQQPREDFAPEQLEELADSLRRIGMLQPVLVRPLEDGRFELVAGERRVRAARLAGLAEVPAVVRHTEDSELLTEALVENLHRVDLNPLEEAVAYQQLLEDFGLTHTGLAERLGRSRPAITNALRLLGLTPELQRRVAEGALRPGHARALLAVPDADAQERAAEKVVAEGLSVRATEHLVRQILAKADDASTPKPEPSPRRRPFGHVEQRLADVLATKVELSGDERRGKIVIDYAGAEDLQRLLDLLGRGVGADLAREGA